MSYIIGVLVIVFGIHQLLYWLYYWQLKEYRWDRFWDGLRHENFRSLGKQFDIRKWYRPKITVRALVTLVFGLIIFAWLKYWWLWWSPIFCWMLVVVVGWPFGVQKRRIIVRAKNKMKKFEGVVIGVTGSYGKSLTKEMLVRVLSSKFKVAYTPENINSEIGVAQAVLKWKGDEEVAIVEMGAYRLGEIKAIAEIVRPKIGIITGIGDQHLSLFRSLENIKKAKYELIESLPKSGLGLVAGVDFDLNEAKKIKVEKEKVSFVYQGVEFEVQVLGRQLIRNVIGVIKVGEYLGMSLREISQSLKGAGFVSGGPKVLKVSQNLTVIDSSYNASLESFLSLLEYLEVWRGYKKIVVTPGLIELGERGKTDHEIVGKKLQGVEVVFLTDGKYCQQMNRWNNVKVVGIGNLIEEINKEMRGKVLLVFKSRVPRVIIDYYAGGKSI